MQIEENTGDRFVFNCFQFNRLTLNTIAAVFITIGTVFDAAVWYYVKNLKIFDDDKPKEVNLTKMNNQSD